jgi:hypothetical protein
LFLHTDARLAQHQVAVIEPGALRKINELLEVETKGRGKVEVLSFTSIGDDEEDAFE